MNCKYRYYRVDHFSNHPNLHVDLQCDGVLRGHRRWALYLDVLLERHDLEVPKALESLPRHTITSEIRQV